MTQVFISYKSQYRDFAKRLRDQVQAWGYSVWIDCDEIKPGDYFRYAIQKGLESSQTVIGVVTQEALESREVQWEWDYGLKNCRLIPIKYRQCDLPYHLQGTQYIDFTSNETEGIQKLKQALLTFETAPHQQVHPESKTHTLTQEEANIRKQLIAKVEEFWLRGVLYKTIEGGEIEIQLEDAPGTVLKHVDYGDYNLPSNAQIQDVFDDLNRELLILGAPGAGKTVLLLQLARHLIKQAYEDEAKCIPVVFNLSSWAVERGTLADWLTKELHQKYKIPQQTAKDLIEHDKILLLLDGLDEVKSSYRNECVDAINVYRRIHKAVDLAICSRVSDYEMLTSKLDLSGAVSLQPLTDTQIDNYISRPNLESLRAIMEEDLTLHEMATTPFLLNAMAYTYQGVPLSNLRLPLSPDPVATRTKHLFSAYVERRLNSSGEGSYTGEQTKHYLVWLAQRMSEFNRTAFAIQDLTPAWLTSQQLKIYDTSIVVIYIVAGVGAASSGALSGFFGGVMGLVAIGGLYLSRNMFFKRNYGRLISDLALELKNNAATTEKAINLYKQVYGMFKVEKPEELTLRIRKDILDELNRAGLTENSSNSLVDGLILDVHQLSNPDFDRDFQQKIVRFLGNFRDPSEYTSNLAKYPQILAVLFTLNVSGHAPINYSNFLDYAASIGVLRKVGGGYIFAHRYLLEYFAEQ